jgi:EPS-associated MarR family transcriptional regulator
MLNDEIRYRILRELEQQPKISQRALAQSLGVSVGKTNYCLRALIDKGLIKVNNFRRSKNKLAYAYMLTPRGISEKARVARRFLNLKQQEYVALSAEIAELRREIGQSDMRSESANEVQADGGSEV